MRPSVMPMMACQRDKNDRHAHKRTSMHGRGASNGHRHLVVHSHDVV